MVRRSEDKGSGIDRWLSFFQTYNQNKDKDSDGSEKAKSPVEVIEDN